MDIFVDGDLRWLVELVVRGRNVQEHIDRLKTGGRYENSVLPLDSRCLEFVMPGQLQTPYLLSDLHMQVLFLNDFQQARIVYVHESVGISVVVNLMP